MMVFESNFEGRVSFIRQKRGQRVFQAVRKARTGTYSNESLFCIRIFAVGIRARDKRWHVVKISSEK